MTTNRIPPLPPSTDAVSLWVCFWTGFAQSEGHPTPLERLHRRVSQKISGPNTIVTLNGWRDNVADRAARIVRWKNGTSPRIVVIGYSYGGWSANNLCRELQKYDMAVESLLLCDPVGRIFGHLPSSLSMLNVIPVRVPANVRNLFTWRQTRDYPRGARIVLDKEFAAVDAGEVNAGTVWQKNKVYRHVVHTAMDDLDDFALTVRSVATAEVVT